MIIYLRHASDHYDDPTFAHDQKIPPSKKNVNDILTVIKHLVATYGNPVAIYCSPFQRARDTLELMKDYLIKETGGDIEVEIDPKLSRYFTSKEKKEPSVRKDTLELEPPIFEKWDDFKERVIQHVDEMIEKGYLRSRHTLVLVITHTLVIKEVAKYLKFETPEYYEFLQWLCVRSHGPKFKPSFLSHGNGAEDKVIQRDINREKGRIRREKEREKRYKKQKKKNDIRRGKKVESSSSGSSDNDDYDTDDLSTIVKDEVEIEKMKQKEKMKKSKNKGKVPLKEKEVEKIKQKLKEREREREYEKLEKERERERQRERERERDRGKGKDKEKTKDGFSIEDHLKQKAKQQEQQIKQSTRLYGKSIEEIAAEKKREQMMLSKKERESSLNKARGGSILDFMNVSNKA